MKKLLNEEGKCPFCGADLDYDVMEPTDNMICYPWVCCADATHKGEEWYDITFAGHSIETKDGMMMEVDEVNKKGGY